MPDDPDGRSPYAESVVQDAFQKASDVGARYFFTWNVNRFVLWDPGKVKLPVLHRQCRDYSLFTLRAREEVDAPTVIHRLRNEFLPKFLEELASLYRGETPFGVLPPDQRFILMLEAFLERPVELTRYEISRLWRSSRAFRRDLTEWAVKQQKWTIPTDEAALEDLLDRAAKQCCYVLANKLIFYEALRSRFPSLKPISVPRTVDSIDRMYGLLTQYFEHAQRVTDDYETIFWPDYGAKVPLLAPGAIDAWKIVIEQIALFNLSKLGYDVLGPIFQRLIDKDAKHKYGQHYTQPTIVDVINAFTIRSADAVILDPGCGSGTFLIRAYARKKWLGAGLDHPTLLSQIYGVDWSGFAVHLSALGLASQDLIHADNYPRVAREDFFDVGPDSKFMTVPRGTRLKTSGLGSKQIEISISGIDAGVGNPPYIRQEEIPKTKKKYYQTIVTQDAPGLDFSGRSDIYVYFWPHLAAFLKPTGYLGLLTSSSWLDVEYGFRLQGWFLANFKIHAILESACEPWFEAARVSTAVTIVQPCSDEVARMRNLVRFVQLRVPLAELLENDGTEDGRQRAAERLRDLILSTEKDTHTDQYRTLVRTQQQLWQEGCRLGNVGDLEDEDSQEDPKDSEDPASMDHWRQGSVYRGGKWGRYLRAPDLFFEIMGKYGDAFVPLGEIAEIRRGITSGCDDFFFPWDCTAEALASESDGRKFKLRYAMARSRVESGKIKIVKAGDGTVWPIEAKHLQPEVHSTMELDSVVVSSRKLKRLILLVNKPKAQLRKTFVLNYIKYGEKETFGGDHPVSERSTCASRELWYDVTGGPRGDVLWPMTHKYRHIIAANPERLVCNHRLFSVRSKTPAFSEALATILNSTFVAFTKHFYGRYAGMEHTLDTEVIDVNMLPVPDVRRASDTVRRSLKRALDNLAKREVGYFLEDAFLDMVPLKKLTELEAAPPSLPQELRQPDRQKLDRAVLALIGVPEAEIPGLLERLYEEITLVYRRGRILDIRTAANKRKAKKTESAGANDVAENVWESLPEVFVKSYPHDFLNHGDVKDHYSLPEGKAKLVEDMFHPPRLKFKTDEIEFRHRDQAKLALTLHESGVRETLSLPSDPERCREVRERWTEYFESLRRTFEYEAAQRTPDEDKADAAVAILLRRAMRA